MSLTEMVLMPGADYQAACDAIREKTETTDLIKSGQMADAIRSIASGEAKLYTKKVIGTGTYSISVDGIPFKPDYAAILPTEPYSLTTANTFNSVYRDFRTFGRIGGGEEHMSASTTQAFNRFKNSTIDGSITYENGEFAFLPPNALRTNIWRKESTYTFIALKYVPDDVTDRELLEQYIKSLPVSGGSVTISAKRLGETGMTEAEFDAYVQSVNPNWTIILE